VVKEPSCFLFLKDTKAYKFQVYKYTKISEWVDNVYFCYRLLLLPSKQTQFEFMQRVQSFSHYWNSPESRVAESVSVLEFQGYPGNDIVVATISFSETRINHKAQM